MEPGLVLLGVSVAADATGLPGLDHLEMPHAMVVVPVGAGLAAFGLGTALLSGTRQYGDAAPADSW